MWRFTPAALDGAAGRLQGVWRRVWAANLYLRARTTLDLKSMAQVACNDFNKKMYRHEPGVSTRFCGLHCVRFFVAMQFQSYKVNPKHRIGKPTANASVWTVSEWIEVQLFGEASRKNWSSATNRFLWAVHADAGGPSRIGLDPSNELYIAKFRCDNNLEWHGYPVHPRGDDIPPEPVLELWRQEEIIDKTDKRRIQTGKF